MQSLTVKQVDVFTTKPFGGNPAAIITEADSLASETMLKIAGEMNLAETTFVTLPSIEGALFRIRYFTPGEEVNLSGHATIAACYALIEDGRIPLEEDMTKVYFETGAGKIQVDVHFRTVDAAEAARETARGAAVLTAADGKRGVLEKIMMYQPVTRHRPSTVSAQEIAKILGIDPKDIQQTGLPLEIISTGFEQLMIPVAHKDTIRDMNPDLIKLGLMNKRVGLHTNHVFSLDTYHEDCAAYLRHFAPAIGMWEDPASGTAAAGLATYLLRHGVVTSGNMIMEQGREVDNLARILVESPSSDESTDGSTDVMRIGGVAVTSITRKIEVEVGEVVVC
jgi:trans-2,3-dihydro-3-hydroxyanthranilate isomerase